MRKAVIRKLFYSDCYFSILLRKRNGNILESMCFQSEYSIGTSRESWCADPFLAEEDGRAYLFFEKAQGLHGRIEVGELHSDCSVSESAPLFADGAHVSYPYVFKKDGSWYMIPETAAAEEVALYAAEQFPYHWKKEAVLLEQPMVDTTVFSLDGQWYLLTFLPVEGTERVTPYAYLIEGTALAPIAWKAYDPLRVRGAGRPFWHQGSLIRPVQINGDHSYGDGVGFVRVSVDPDGYHETPVSELRPKNVRAKELFYDGLHTYSQSEHFEAIDLRCWKFTPFKPIRALTRHLRSLFGQGV